MAKRVHEMQRPLKRANLLGPKRVTSLECRPGNAALNGSTGANPFDSKTAVFKTVRRNFGPTRASFREASLMYSMKTQGDEKDNRPAIKL